MRCQHCGSSREFMTDVLHNNIPLLYCRECIKEITQREFPSERLVIAWSDRVLKDLEHV